MKKSSLVGHVIQVLDQIRGSQQPADLLLAAFFRSRRYLGSRDRRFITEYLYGILRNRRHLEALATAALTDLGAPVPPDGPPSAALIATYEVRFLKSDAALLPPDYQGLWRIEGTEPSVAAFLAALQAVDLHGQDDGGPVAHMALEHSLPEFAVAEWIDRFGVQDAAELCRAINQPAATTIRVNTLLCTVKQCMAALQREGIATARTRYSPVGLVLAKRVNAQSLMAFQQGWFEMQDEGSQLVGMLTGAAPGMTVVDACAGGGGKTLHMAAMMRNQGRIMATDVEARRLASLEKRMARAGVRNVAILRPGEPSGAWDNKADAVLVDAPCTGSGTLRRNPGARETLTPGRVAAMERTQNSVLEQGARFVRPGGRLVYATCSLMRSENEAVVEQFLQQRHDFARVPALSVLQETAAGDLPPDVDPPYMLLLPHQTGTDGFFAAVLRRSAD